MGVFECAPVLLSVYACSELWGAALREIPSESVLEQSLVRQHVLCLASGTLGDVQKFYFYAQDLDDGLYMVEFSITTTSKRLSAMVKAPTQAQGARFSQLLKDCLRDVCEP